MLSSLTYATERSERAFHEVQHFLAMAIKQIRNLAK